VPLPFAVSAAVTISLVCCVARACILC